MIYLFIEFLDDGFECLEVWFFYWVFCLVLFDDDSKFVIWIVVFFECWLEVRFDFVFYFFVNFCIKIVSLNIDYIMDDVRVEEFVELIKNNWC